MCNDLSRVSLKKYNLDKYLPPQKSLDFWFKSWRHHHYCNFHAYKTRITWTTVFCWQWRCSLVPLSTVVLIFASLLLAHSEESIPQEESTCGGFPNGKSFQTKLHLHRFKPLMGGIFPSEYSHYPLISESWVLLLLW